MEPAATSAEGAEIRIILLGRPDRCGYVQALQDEPGFKIELCAPQTVLEDEAAAFPEDTDVCLIDAAALPDRERARTVGMLLSVLVAEHRRLRPIVLVPTDDAVTRCAAAAGLAWDVLPPSRTGELGARIRRAAMLARLMRAEAPEHHGAARPAAPSGREGVGDRATTPEGLPLGRHAPDGVWGIVGSSLPMRRVFAQIEQVAVSDVPILVTGESGTGKELVAQAIVRRSARCDGRLVPINCGAIPEALLESELFGHERGAFTGATRARRGRLEAAHGGTLFLDEIGDLAPLLQVKLLRFLEDHRVERVGGRQAISLDVRVIAATNRDLQAAVADGSFREDLYYRLAVFTLEMPPLRDREDDVLLLADFYLERYAGERGGRIRGFSEDAREELRRHPWPGNVRELINRVRRAVVIAEGAELTRHDLGLAEPEPETGRICLLREARRAAEITCIQAALRRAAGNKSEAARLLGVSRTQLYELMRRHELPDHPVS